MLPIQETPAAAEGAGAAGAGAGAPAEVHGVLHLLRLADLAQITVDRLEHW